MKSLLKVLVAGLVLVFLHPHLHAQVGFAPAVEYSVGTNRVSVTAADINSDGKVDLMSANNVANTILVITNNGSGVFGSNATYAVGIGPRFVTATDVNGDGEMDLILRKLRCQYPFNTDQQWQRSIRTRYFARSG